MMRSERITETKMLRASIKRLKSAWNKRMAIAVDPNAVNRQSKDMAETLEELKQALEMSFVMKNAIAEARHYDKVYGKKPRRSGDPEPQASRTPWNPPWI